ncbi:fungal-specific transcription factor domain-containing protein [Ilyonectria robusta]|uniref:fungal-specific transcription factor domain-containing protein n=1 Tax=Ilyonectria robusta TaxID=1079257 RepID=UPI001E8EB43C|nr:fungal-specific transcription factor domain-containing protein [Ilyonectria robusta]KAH8684112.1 fungal-specific transcription factor domain-containing protein [Ilyonectria robusta]
MYTPPEEAEAARSNRRKVCDLCFTKKIKCDMLKPVCSNCILYKADCKTSIIRRKANPPKAKPAPPGQADGRVETLEARLARIENQLQQVLDAARDVHRPAGNTDSLPQRDPGRRDEVDQVDLLADPIIQDTIPEETGGQNPWRFDPIEPRLYQGPEPDVFVLPPLDEILPTIDHYFAAFNQIIPLFHQNTFMKMLHSWYNDPTPRDRGAWAAVQIVMALGYRMPRLTATDTVSVQIDKADRCLKSAQAVISELVTRDEDLLGVQILLGIVMLFQNSRDPKPASVIIGTAVRLAHKLGLHSAEASKLFSVEEAEQRSRVLWIAYSLDKDISLRAYTPSIMSDDDIDVPLPVMAPADSSGFIWTQNGQAHFNYHRRRVELAHIEGKVYDLLYSNRAAKVKGALRHQRVARLQAMLDQWYERVPSVFHIENVAANVGPGQLVQLTKMHHAYLMAEVMTHGIYSHNADWVKRISSFSRSAIYNMQSIPNKFRNLNCMSNKEQAAPLPEGWSKCVEVSRGCMDLFQGATPTECLIWQCSCAHFSGLIILLANMSLDPGHELVAFDQHLALRAINLFDKLLDIIDDEGFKALRLVIGELSQKANLAVETHRLENAQSGNAVFESLCPDAGALQPIELEYLPQDTEFGEVNGSFAEFDVNEFQDSVFGQTYNATDLRGIPAIADLEDFLR